MRLIKIILICFLSGQLFGTGQIPDFLIYQEDTLLIHSNPLEWYFDKVGSRALPKFKGCSSTGCWRGYVAYWELRNDSIFLKEVTTCHEWKCDTIVNADLKELFGTTYRDNEVFADWISFEVINPHGKQIKYIHQGYESIYEFERGFDIKNGILQQINKYDNRRSKESMFRKDSLFSFLLQTVDWKLIEGLKLDKKKRVIARFKTDEIGRPIEIEIVRGVNAKTDKEAIRVIKLIPEWDVYFKRGKVIKTQWVLPVFFDKAFYEKKIK